MGGREEAGGASGVGVRGEVGQLGGGGGGTTLGAAAEIAWARPFNRRIRQPQAYRRYGRDSEAARRVYLTPPIVSRLFKSISIGLWPVNC